VTHVPAGVDAAEAAMLILSWATAYQLLHRAARVHQRQRVLAVGAAGAVGQALLVRGKLAGLELWGGARGTHAALIRKLGATPIDTERDDITRTLPGGFDVVFDGVGKDGFGSSFAAVKRGGLLCAYGYAGSRGNVVDPKANEIAAAQLAVDSEIEERQIAFAALHLKPDTNAPDLFRPQGTLLADEPALVPRRA
jgi:NADPH:quinone reductase-like Zn-dependent oxidoreductase